MLEYQNPKIFLLRDIIKGDQKKFSSLVPWTYVISDLNGKGITGSLNEKELQKTNQKEFRTERIIKSKGKKNICKMERI